MTARLEIAALCHTVECTSLSLIIGVHRGTRSFQYLYYKPVIGKVTRKQLLCRTAFVYPLMRGIKRVHREATVIQFMNHKPIRFSCTYQHRICIMECRRFRSVVSIMEPLPGRRLSTSSSTPSVPVSGTSLSFSISAILGLEDDQKQQDLPKKGEFPFIVPREYRYVIS